MNLHYSQTNWYNYTEAAKILLPYEFTLFSNDGEKKGELKKFYYLMNLHYSQTQQFVPVYHFVFYYLMNLHYSQTKRLLFAL